MSYNEIVEKERPVEKVHLLAVTAFGLEAVVKRELVALGFSDVKASDTRVDFFGEFADAVPKANLWLRTAERVMFVVGEFAAETFTQLFDGIFALPWGDILPEDAKFTITAKSVRSKLFSVSDCQSIGKKAVAEKLKLKYHLEWLPETGAEYKIQIGLMNDKATVAMDTSGAGLHKRGYRPEAIEAPIKETLASALVQLTYWRVGRVLYDPFCGSGTIPIESAMIAKNIAPGLMRHFAAEKWGLFDSWRDERQKAREVIRPAEKVIFGTDVDPRYILLANANAKRAGVDDCINFARKDVFDAVLPAEYGVSVINPPYGERLLNADEAARLYVRIGQMFRETKKWSVCVLTSDEGFEKHFGKRADAKRKLFNGMIKTNYYQYFGEKPPKTESV